MAILLDSASIEELEQATRLGFVRGFTTNPTLMARVTDRPQEHFCHLLRAFSEGPAFYQPVGTVDDILEQARRIATASCGAQSSGPGTGAATPSRRVVIKLPATGDGVRAASQLVPTGIRCALTAVYSPAQALLAHETGCEWAIPYIDRAERLGVGGISLLDDIAALFASLGSATRILAASLKSAEQVAAAIRHGAHDVTAPLDVLVTLAEHPFSQAAVAEFESAAGRSPRSSAPA